MPVTLVTAFADVADVTRVGGRRRPMEREWIMWACRTRYLAPRCSAGGSREDRDSSEIDRRER